MEEFITPSRIANSILQDKSFSGHYVLLEGKKDIRVYSRFLLMDNARPKATFGKQNLREVYEILDQRGFFRKIGIRDADFLRVAGNKKFDHAFDKMIFPTDGHDAEMMMIEVGVLNDLCAIVVDGERVNELEKRHSCNLQDIILKNMYSLGCLRLANKRYELGLSFKPDRLGGNRLRIDKFISGRDCKLLNNEVMINTVYEYSKNRGSIVASRNEIKDKLDIVISENHPGREIVNGHDAAEFLRMILKDALNVKSKSIQDLDSVENLMASSFDWMKFINTNLYYKIKIWQDESGVKIFKY